MGCIPVVGQQRVKELLVSSARRNRLAHAYLFHGLPGVGKDAAAIAMAAMLNCESGEFGGCGECISCRRLVRGDHTAFRLVMPFPTKPKTMKDEKYIGLRREAVLNRIGNPYRDTSVVHEIASLPVIGIDDIREIKREVTLRLAGASHRLILISGAHGMTVPAANSLLKLLEEPPAGTVLVLTTCAPETLLPTLVSRCQCVLFDALNEREIADALVHRWRLPEGNARFLAGLAGGSLQRALEFSEEGFQDKRDAAAVFLETCVGGDAVQRLDAVAQLTDAWDKREILFVLQMMQALVRDWMHLGMGFTDRVINHDRLDQLRRWIGTSGRFDAEYGLESIQQAIDLIGKNVYLPMVLYGLGQNLGKHGSVFKESAAHVKNTGS